MSVIIPPIVKRVPARPGDPIVFTEALSNGVLPRVTSAPIKTLFYKSPPHGTSWGGDYFHPEDFRHYTEIDSHKMAILAPPNARYATRPTHLKLLKQNADDLAESTGTPR